MGPKVALMQPTFLPWQGYFALMDAADVFVFLDDFQFVRRSFHQRNRLLLGGGRETWVTVPVSHAGTSDRPALRDVRPDADGAFRRKLTAGLEHGYGRAPHYDELLPGLRDWIEGDWTDLASVNIAFIELAAGWLGLGTSLRRSSELDADGRRSARIADLLRRAGADCYLSAFGSFDYMRDDGVFPLADVDVRFQVFEPPAYAQRGVADFVPYLSALDALFQAGPEETARLLREGQRFLTWDEREAAGSAAGVTP